MPVHTLDYSPMAYGLYSVNGVVPELAAPGYLEIGYMDGLVGPTILKEIWGVSAVRRIGDFEIETSVFVSNEKKSTKLKRDKFEITFLPFLFKQQFDSVEKGLLHYGQIAYQRLMGQLAMQQHFVFGDCAGAPNLINADYCVAVELISAPTSIDDFGNRTVVAEFHQTFLGNFPY